MAKTFKPSPFENIIRKYTLCGLCDGKIISSSFLQCGCSVILCIYCNEKHSCKFRHQAVKFDSYKDNKSISFIHQLSEIITSNLSEKEKEKKELLEISYSPSLPDLDDLPVDITSNGELSFSQLFDNKFSRNEKPRNSINKRESISPRISYTLKRKQYLSDSDDESSDKSESILYKRLTDCNSSSKKKVTKKMKFSNGNQDINNLSSNACESESINSDNQPLGRRRINRKSRRSLPADLSIGVVNDVTNLSFNAASTTVPESCQVVKENNVPLRDITVKNSSSYLQKCVNKKKIKDIKSPVLNMSNDNLRANNVDSGLESSLQKDTNEDKINSSDKLDNIECSMIANIDDNPISKDGDEKTKAYNLMKERNSLEHSKEPKTHGNKTATNDKQIEDENNHLSTCTHGDFDGFEQSDINASTLNYMLYNLTSPFTDTDEIFPIYYRGKKFIIHIKGMVDTESSDNECHYILKPFKTFNSNFVQTEELQTETEANDVRTSKSGVHDTVEACVGTEDQYVGITQSDVYDAFEPCVNMEVKDVNITQADVYETVEACIGQDSGKTVFVQTDSYQVMDACMGRDSGKDNFVQTYGYQVINACVGRDSEKSSFAQTDSYQVVNSCVGPEVKISKVTQTERYKVQDSFTSTKSFRCCAVQTDQIYSSSSDLWSRNHTVSFVQTDLCYDKSTDDGLDMPDCTNVIHHFSPSNMVKENTTSEITTEATPDVRETSDSEEEDIIEGTPIKENNLSLASLNLSAVKERTLHFDWNEPTATRDEIVSCSDLVNVDKLCVQKFAKIFGMKYSEYFNNKTTHLVVSPRLTHDSHKTFKYLIAIASKACIVSIDWVKDSIRKKEVLPADHYIPTNQPGPKRCRMNVGLPFAGLTLCVQLLTNYPGVKAMEALCKLCGAYIVEGIEHYDPPQKWPFPRFCLFEDESQLTSQIINSCRKHHILAVNYEWVFDSVAAYSRQPVIKHLCSSFILTDDVIETFKIPSDMLVNHTL